MFFGMDKSPIFNFSHMMFFSSFFQKQKVKVKLLSRVWLFATPWTVGHQAPLSVGFPRQEYRSGLPFPSPGDLPNPGIKPGSPALQADALTSEPPGKPSETEPILKNNLHDQKRKKSAFKVCF